MSAALTRAVVEIERHVAAGGWDQPPRLYALVETADLLRREPGLASALEAADSTPGALTPVEQEGLDPGRPLDEVLAGIGWPPEVIGAALVVERLLLPPSAEASLPADLDGQDLSAWVAEHPERQDVRITVGVLRDGQRDTALRLRSDDRNEAVLSGPDLVPGLAAALAATLAD